MNAFYLDQQGSKRLNLSQRYDKVVGLRLWHINSDCLGTRSQIGYA